MEGITLHEVSQKEEMLNNLTHLWNVEIEPGNRQYLKEEMAKFLVLEYKIQIKKFRLSSSRETAMRGGEVVV